jgi:hypothetical protein
MGDLSLVTKLGRKGFTHQGGHLNNHGIGTGHQPLDPATMLNTGVGEPDYRQGSQLPEIPTHYNMVSLKDSTPSWQMGN